MRANLQKIANSCERDLKPLKLTSKDAADNLARAMGIPETKKDLILQANTQRQVLALPPLEDLTPSTSLKDGLTAVAAAVSATVPMSSKGRFAEL